ncbi:hypothetical protein BJ546DRAFT_179115 [Cryomyces antarcticus]
MFQMLIQSLDHRGLHCSRDADHSIGKNPTDTRRTQHQSSRAREKHRKGQGSPVRGNAPSLSKAATHPQHQSRRKSPSTLPCPALIRSERHNSTAEGREHWRRTRHTRCIHTGDSKSGPVPTVSHASLEIRLPTCDTLIPRILTRFYAPPPSRSFISFDCSISTPFSLSLSLCISFCACNCSRSTAIFFRISSMSPSFLFSWRACAMMISSLARSRRASRLSSS